MRHLNEEETKIIMACFPKLNQVINSLEKFVNKEIIKDLKEVMNSMSKSCERIWELEEKELEENQNMLDEISDKEGFVSVWSTDITAKNINNIFTEKIKSLNYDGMTEKVGKTNKKHVTYLDLWKAADKLISRSEKSDHIFIEDFIKDNNGNFHLSTGS